MTLYEFHALREENQLVYIWDNGEFLMLRLESKQVRVSLYVWCTPLIRQI
jgi:hypothetical protein